MMGKNIETPKHVAIIMDGNRRWAKKKGLPVFAGHVYVVENLLERLIEQATKKGIEYITFWAWSTENWKRGEKEVSSILKLFRKALEKKAGKLIKNGARVRIIGDVKEFPKDIQKGLNKMMKDSKDNKRINVTFALNYGGREEIIKSVRKIMKDVLRLSGSSHRSRSAQDDKLSLGSLESLSKGELEKMFESSLDTIGIPDPDMIIRPGGEKRLSGFMLWQSEYSELYFTDVLMPDFNEKELDKVIEEYMDRQRRFGGS